jgi:hypothetical protein
MLKKSDYTDLGSGGAIHEVRIPFRRICDEKIGKKAHVRGRQFGRKYSVRLVRIEEN